ncbi:DEAD/DEAH box helicase [Natronorubrum sp. A-ect3]|uniref:DEAD/DEAH box helicase n=1 Tax=Natronorubrum sp. A-ect3 TaxID=3242698 RepID=UPI00359DEFAB
MRTAYETYLQGRGGTPAKSVSARLQPDSAGESTLAGMRGPYLQALPIANWSDTDWQTFARSQSLHPNVTRAFHKEGFRRLYDFQERSVETILDGDDTVITAATGRGKTEAWLIPILDQIVKAKRNSDAGSRTSTKALLMYPTKALAQDQFKRLVQILYRINRNLRRKEWVTVGIYDGDTPRHIFEDGAQGYLNRTFEHFGCPGANDDLAKCQSCGQGVFVERTTDDFKLRPDKPACEDDRPHHVPLDFVRTTRSSLMNDGADIVLTNPDTLNYRLFNINAETEQELFVYEPEFIVFDEVHTYDGLLGSYTATLIKRLRRLRDEANCPQPQVIGSSATVENDAELFRQISGAESISQVSENPRELTATSPQSVPDELLTNRVSTDELLASGRGEKASPPQVGDADLLAEQANTLDNDRLEDRVAEKLFDQLTTDPGNDLAVQAFQSLHTTLADEPQPPKEFRERIAEQFDITDNQAEVLVDNFQTIGEFAGLLESRHHLFSWPLDGFYACASCSAVYRSPQEHCRACNGKFVTRATYCKQCSDEHLIANACPACDQLVPYVHSDEGLIGGETQQECPYCRESRDEPVPMDRVVFQPWIDCQACNHRTERSVVETCESCGSPAVIRSDDRYICRNPGCEEMWKRETGCSVCGESTRSTATVNATVDCPECGRTHESPNVLVDCECGQTVANTRLIPWTCADDNCDEVYFTQNPPETCSCTNTGPFVKAGLYEVMASDECQNCGTDVTIGGSCDCEEPELVLQNQPYRRYKTRTGNGTIVSPLEYRSAMPCDHDLWSTVIDDPFDELMRSPTNVAVTTSRYLLRELADSEGFDDAKLLAFSDSHRDMKELDRSFMEPEIDIVLDQLVLASLDLATHAVDLGELSPTDLRKLRPGADSFPNDIRRECDWVDLETVVDTAFKLLKALEDELTGENARESASLDLGAVVIGTESVDDREDRLRDEIRRRIVRHAGERRSPGAQSLESDGLVDVRLRSELVSDLNTDERTIIRALVDAGNRERIELLSLEGVRGDHHRIIDSLASDGFVTVLDDDRLAFAPNSLEVSHAATGSIDYDPYEDEYYSHLQTSFGFGTQAVACDDSLLDRTDPDQPRFSERAYTATRSRVAFLLSKLYYGGTSKMERREIEYQFRDSDHPHFLSSGPTMELGVDIGSLDSLLMYGTPPNMNAYLQRVGRAGRSSNSSLVHSVSQRNPIDYYYYDEPTELITADKQPVPLNEHNERVLRISLAWAVLDYIAATFTIPWESSQHDIAGGGDFIHQSEATPDQRETAAKFTKLLANSATELNLGTDNSRLRPLGTIVSDYEDDISEYLDSLLEYAYCPHCYRHYDRTRGGDECSETDCDGVLVDALAEHAHLIDDAIDAVLDVYVNGYRNHVEEIAGRINAHEEQIATLQTELERADADTESRLRHKKDQLDRRVTVLEDYLDDQSGRRYYSILGDAFGEFAFNLRSVSDSVDVQLVDESGEPERIGDDDGGRSSRLALSELHPAAAYLHDRRPHIVSQVFTHDKKSADLRETVTEKAASASEEAIARLAYEYICSTCGSSADEPDIDCDCNGDGKRRERRLIALESVEATLDTEPLANGKDVARTMYDSPSERVQNTFSQRETAILEFDPVDEFELQTQTGKRVGVLSFGEYEVLEYTDSFRAKYQSGGIDEHETPFELCTEPDCPGVIYTDRDETRRCSVNADHKPDEGSESIYARIGYEYATEGVRLSLDSADSNVTHSLAHGLRLALQKLSGVTIRDVNEHIGTDHVDVFDSQEGGAAVSRLLVRERVGEYQNFQAAMEVIATQFDCDCSDGCPRCLYQYGCEERNQPQSLNREDAAELVDKGLKLVPIENR